MTGAVLLALAVGLAFGLLLGWVFLAGPSPLHEFPAPTVEPTCLSNGQLQIGWTAAGIPPDVTLVALHTRVYDDPAATVPSDPYGQGATVHPNPASPVYHALPPGLAGPYDKLAVWAEYRQYRLTEQAYPTCTGGSGGSSGFTLGGPARRVSGETADRLEAVPQAYRVSPGSPLAGAGGGPANDLVGALNRAAEPVLEYDPNASTPAEPVWRTAAGAGPAGGWTLRLLHRAGGFGAVLGVVRQVGGRDVHFTWVTSNWQFHAANRLAPEADEPSVPVLLVRPA